MRTNDLLWDAVNKYLESNGRRVPKFIAVPKPEFKKLCEEVNANIPKEMYYIPSTWNGIPLVESVAEREIRCCP